MQERAEERPELLGDTRGAHGDFEDALTSPPPDLVAADVDTDDIPVKPLVSGGAGVPAPPDDVPVIEVEQRRDYYGE
jgi:hypothetical protein